MRLNAKKSMGLDDMHPRVIKELADVVAKILLSLFEKSWVTDQVSSGWKKGNINPVFKTVRKKDPANCRLMILTYVPGKIMELNSSVKITCEMRGRLEKVSMTSARANLALPIWLPSTME